MNMYFNSIDDGTTHINIYSKANTALGVFLSNFTQFPLVTEDGYFESIEGYWYWLISGDDNLRELHGNAAKKYGKTVSSGDWLKKDTDINKIKRTIKLKIDNSEYKDEFYNSTLPFTHYYVYEGKIHYNSRSDWFVEHMEALREQNKLLSIFA